MESYNAHIRDRQQQDSLIHSQLDERQALQHAIQHVRSQQDKDIHEIKHKLFSSLSKDKSVSLQTLLEPSELEGVRSSLQRDSGLGLSM